jgi:hypothetical protein
VCSDLRIIKRSPKVCTRVRVRVRVRAKDRVRVKVRVRVRVRVKVRIRIRVGVRVENSYKRLLPVEYSFRMSDSGLKEK